MNSSSQDFQNYNDESHENPQTSVTNNQQYAYLTINPAVKKPWIMRILLGMTITIFLFQILSQVLFQGNDIPALMGMKINERILSGELWRLFSPVLLHGSLIHLGFNMYALYIFGSGLERHYGHSRFLILYLLSAYAGNVFSFLLSPNPSLGASTSIFGLVAAEGVFIYRNKFLFGKNARSMLINILTIVAINLFLGLSPGIDNWGHLGGLLGGFLFSWYAGPLLKLEGTFPMLTVQDRTPQKSIWLYTIFVFILISMIALTKLFFII